MDITDLSKLSVLGKSLPLTDMKIENSEILDSKGCIHVGGLSDRNYEKLRNRIIQASKVEKQLYERDILKLNNTLKKNNKKFKVKKLSTSKHNLRDKNVKGYLNLENNISNLPKQIEENLEYGSQISQTGGNRLANVVDITDRASQEFLRHIDPTGLPSQNARQHARQHNSAIFILKLLVPQQGIRFYICYEDINNLNAGSKGLYHNYYTTNEGHWSSYAHSSRGQLGANVLGNEVARNFHIYPPFNTHYYRPCVAGRPPEGGLAQGHPIHAAVQPQMIDHTSDSQFLYQCLLGGQDGDFNSVGRGLGLLINTTSNTPDYNSDTFHTMKGNHQAAGVIEAGDILFFEMCSGDEVNRFHACEYSHLEYPNVGLGVHRKFFRLSDNCLDLKKTSGPICYTQRHDQLINYWSQRLNNVNQINALSYLHYDLPNNRDWVIQMLAAPAPGQQQLIGPNYAERHLRELLQHINFVDTARTNMKIRFIQWVQEVGQLPDDNPNKQRFVRFTNMFCGDGADYRRFLENDRQTQHPKGRRQRHCGPGLKNNVEQTCMKRIWSTIRPGQANNNQNRNTNYTQKCRENNFERLIDQASWYNNKISMVTSRCPLTLPSIDARTMAQPNDHSWGDIFYEKTYFRNAMIANGAPAGQPLDYYYSQFWRNPADGNEVVQPELNGFVKLRKHGIHPGWDSVDAAKPDFWSQAKYYNTIYRGVNGAWHECNGCDAQPAQAGQRRYMFKQYASCSVSAKTAISFARGDNAHLYCFKVAPDVPYIPFSTLVDDSESCYDEGEILLPPGCILIIPDQPDVRYDNILIIRGYIYYADTPMMRQRTNHYINDRSPTIHNSDTNGGLLHSACELGSLCKTKLRIPSRIIGNNYHRDNLADNFQNNRYNFGQNKYLRSEPPIDVDGGGIAMRRSLGEFWNDLNIQFQMGGKISNSRKNQIKELMKPRTNVIPGKFALKI